MNHWVIKANPKNLDPDAWIKKDHRDSWWGEIPKNLKIGDRLFFWKSSPEKKLYALGELVQFLKPEKNNGYSCRVVFSTDAFNDQPTIVSLKPLFGTRVPSFLRSGPAGTFFPLADVEAKKLYSELVRRNSTLAGTWVDLEKNSANYNELVELIPDVDISVVEGTERLVAHLRRERNMKIVAAKKAQVLKSKGKLECEVCSFDFVAAYGGTLGNGFCEVHHRLPLAKGVAKRNTSLSDLAIICSNCHRMIHRTNPMKSIETFKRMLKNQ